MADLGYVDEQAAPSTGGADLLPVGEYVAMVVESDVKDNSKRTGRYLELKFVVLEGPHANAIFYITHNHQHQNAKTQEIAQRELSALRQATGVNSPRDSAEFHNKPIMVSLKVRPAEGTYGPKNELRTYKPYGGGPQPVNQQQAAPPAYAPPPRTYASQTTQQAAPPPTAQAPWRRP